jgi:nucleoid-associated protein YgaU
MIRKLLIGAASAAALVLSSAAFAQQFGTAPEAKALLEKAIAAVKADKAKALEAFNKADGGFKDKDLYVFCFNVPDGAINAGPVKAGTDIRTLKDKAGKTFGQEMFDTVKEGTFNEISYMFPRPGGTDPVAKVSYVTKAGDTACGVGYYK